MVNEGEDKSPLKTKFNPSFFACTSVWILFYIVQIGENLFLKIVVEIFSKLPKGLANPHIGGDLNYKIPLVY